MANIVIKRDGREVPFKKEKIANDISDDIEIELKDIDKVSISQIEELVYNKLISKKQRLTAKAYEDYRAVREYQRQHNTIDNKVLGIIDGTNNEYKERIKNIMLKKTLTYDQFMKYVNTIL